MMRKNLLFGVVFGVASSVIGFGQGPGHMMQGGMGGMGGMHGRMMGGLPKVIDSATNPTTPAKVALGRMLFYDPRLSEANDISCNSCHDLAKYGVDGKPVSPGHKGQLGSRNSPTVYNAAGHLAQFWDGRAADVEEQAKGPVMNPVEMAMLTEKEVVGRLEALPGYVKAFRAAFPGEAQPISFDNMAKAIGVFERGLVTPSRWDRFVGGDNAAVTDGERLGFHHFMHNGCTTCHNGPYVGGGKFEKLGKVNPWLSEADLGRIGVTKRPEDRMVFKVPSLRNVSMTGPYFHNGKVATLDEAVRLMGNHQLGVQLNEAEVTLIVSWLKSLTGELPLQYIKKPKLP